MSHLTLHVIKQVLELYFLVLTYIGCDDCWKANTSIIFGRRDWLYAFHLVLGFSKQSDSLIFLSPLLQSHALELIFIFLTI